MARRTDEQIFLDELTYMAGEPPVRVSSQALMSALDWGQDRYDRTRRRLVDGGVVKGVVGGAGGSLELLAGANELAGELEKAPKVKPVTAFISYSHADAKLKADLITHLTPLKRLGIISAWNDQEIKAGDEWEKEIATKLAKADVVLLLISADFVASEFCYTRELTTALDRHKAKKAMVIPVILRPCLWTDLPFGALQAAAGSQAVTSWDNQDEALMAVAKGVREAIQALKR